MENKLKVFFSDNEDWAYRHQRVWSNDCEQVSYSVYDLCECPEDAKIGRDLFSGREYINAIKLGMELAKQGYTGIEIEEVPYED